MISKQEAKSKPCTAASFQKYLGERIFLDKSLVKDFVMLTFENFQDFAAILALEPNHAAKDPESAKREILKNYKYLYGTKTDTMALDVSPSLIEHKPVIESMFKQNVQEYFQKLLGVATLSGKYLDYPAIYKSFVKAHVVKGFFIKGDDQVSSTIIFSLYNNYHLGDDTLELLDALYSKLCFNDDRETLVDPTVETEDQIKELLTPTFLGELEYDLELHRLVLKHVEEVPYLYEDALTSLNQEMRSQRQIVGCLEFWLDYAKAEHLKIDGTLYRMLQSNLG